MLLKSTLANVLVNETLRRVCQMCSACFWGYFVPWQIHQNDRLAVSKLVTNLTRGSMRSPLVQCLLIRFTCQVHYYNSCLVGTMGSRMIRLCVSALILLYKIFPNSISYVLNTRTWWTCYWRVMSKYSDWWSCSSGLMVLFSLPFLNLLFCDRMQLHVWEVVLHNV